ncbi:polysaccharide biosynthesis C-terminal domain-containing protein, partial [bacterium]|nr:polysaccharide biosynthesis C-terminal domain-containing protein [bacterium]
EYALSVEVVRWLAVTPLLQSIHYLAANTLTGAGFQNIRGSIQLAVAGINILLNLWLIPIYSWKGAAWSTIGSEALLCILLCGSLAYVYRRDESKIDSAVDREKKDSPAYT